MDYINTEHIYAGYGEQEILQDLTFGIRKGMVTSIIGSNGCGKSTILKTLARIMNPKKGVIYLDGKEIVSQPNIQIAKKMAVLPQSPKAPGGLTVEELTAYGRYPHQKGFGRLSKLDREKITWALELTNMLSFKNRLLSTLSGGQRQRAWIAMALAQDSEMILLDEPTTYLDLVHQLEVMELLKKLNKQEGKTIALVIHELNMASRFSDWMIAVKKGEIVKEGKPSDIMTTEVLKDVFSIDADIMIEPGTGKPVFATYHVV